YAGKKNGVVRKNGAVFLCRSELLPRADAGRDDRFDPTPNVEVADDFHPARRTRGRQVVEDSIDRTLVEDAVVAEAPQVELQCLELEANLVGDVGDDDRAEVRRATFQLRQLRCVGFDSTDRTERSELGTF